jgi:hypothetical protein
MRTFRCLPIALLTFTLAGCSKPVAHDHAAAAGHHHTAPHGGTLVELGEHAYTLELVRDFSAGTLTAYVLDGHAEKFVRIPAPSIELVAMPGGKFTPSPLKAVANPVTGETVGDTSQFAVQADWLKTADEVAGIVSIEIKGEKFEQVGFVLSK